MMLFGTLKSSYCTKEALSTVFLPKRRIPKWTSILLLLFKSQKTRGSQSCSYNHTILWNGCSVHKLWKMMIVCIYPRGRIYVAVYASCHLLCSSPWGMKLSRNYRTFGCLSRIINVTDNLATTSFRNFLAFAVVFRKRSWAIRITQVHDTGIALRLSVHSSLKRFWTGIDIFHWKQDNTLVLPSCFMSEKYY